MSERYGTPGELQESLEDFDEWVCDEIERSRSRLRRTDGLGDPRFESGRLDALREVLSWWEIDGK
jgi:hypothetical protein